MTEYFSSDFFLGNRRSLAARTQTDIPILVTANGLLQRGADSAYAFSQDANFWYLTGIDEPDITLVMHEGDEFIIVPSREESRETFDGSVDVEQLRRVSGIQKIIDETAGWKHLDELLNKTKRVCMPVAADAYLQHYGMYTNPSRARVEERLRHHVDGLQIMDIRPELAKLRMIKQVPELAAIQAAVDVTSETLNEVLAVADGYKAEYEVEADIFRGFRARGASGHSFEPIVAGGKNACTLHNVANDMPLQPNDLVVCDVGAEVSHYAADITRTVCFGRPSARQRDIYKAVQEVQEYGLGLMKPGALLRDIEDAVAKRMGHELKALGLIKRVDKHSVRQFYPHALSHYMGLNVHDVGDYMRPLEPGVVLTCEPGIYVPAEGIGVRLEDDVLITEQGHTVLSAACRKQIGPVH